MNILGLFKKKKLGQKIFRKATHMNLYINNSSHHHLAQKFSVLSTLLHRTQSITYEELKTLRKILAQNGHSWTAVDQALACRRKLVLIQWESEEEPIRGVAMVPFCSTVTNSLTRLLRRNI